MISLSRGCLLRLSQICIGTLVLHFGFPQLQADKPAGSQKPIQSRAKVLRLLFEADVYQALHAWDRARELYHQADPSGTCPEQLVSAYFGHGEALFLYMEAARLGDMSALRSALNLLFFNESGQSKHPLLALELYETAKKANPKGYISDEAQTVELLKMASAAKPFDYNAFLNQHGLNGLNDEEPYFCWKLAEEASVGGRFGKPDPQLALQLAVCGSGSLSERLSAVRAAHANWVNKDGTKFEYKAHISTPVTATNKPEKEDYELKEEKKEREFQEEFARMEAVFKNPRVLSMDLKDVPEVKRSEDGKLRILSWDTNTGGTLHNYCSMAQFQSPDGKAGYALLQAPLGDDVNVEVPIFGKISKIDTVLTNSKETVYLVWSSGRVATRRFAESVTAIALKNGRIVVVPFFKTKRELLTQISFTAAPSISNDQLFSEVPDFQFSKENGQILLVPIISDDYDFSGKYLKYVFDGKYFTYKGIQ
jgi:hypothetical protein